LATANPLLASERVGIGDVGHAKFLMRELLDRGSR
jgi:hypothetical protein